LGEFFAFFSFDTRLFRTIPVFLLKSGYLARSYLDGQRKHYMAPLRLYLFLSIVFFFLARTACVGDFSCNALRLKLIAETEVSVSTGDTIETGDYILGFNFDSAAESGLQSFGEKLTKVL